MKLNIKSLNEGLTNFINRETGKRGYYYKFQIKGFEQFPLDDNETSYREKITDALKKKFKTENGKRIKDYRFCTAAEYYTKTYNLFTGKYSVGKLYGDGKLIKTKLTTIDKLDFCYFDSINSLLVDTFYVYIFRFDEDGKKVGNSDSNDCLYNALSFSVNNDKSLLPKKINSPSKLKRYFNYERDEKVDIEEVLPELRKLFKKTTITVVGDYEHIPTDKKQLNITLRVTNGHIKLVHSKTRFIMPSMNTKTEIVSMAHCGEDVKIYNGSSIKSIDYDAYDKFKNDFKIVKVIANNADELKQKYDDYIKKIEHYKSRSKFIDFSKSSYTSHIAYQIWSNFTKDIKEPEELLTIEHYACRQSNRGGLHYGSKTKEGFDYDQNNFYLHYMMSNAFTYPNKQPDEQIHMTTDELNKREFFQYGLYKCKITGSSIYVPKSMCNTYQWHNHFNFIRDRFLCRLRIA